MHTILVIDSGLFLGEVVNRYLLRFSQQKIVVVSPKSDEEMLAAIQEHQPAVIVMDDTIYQRDTTKLALFLQDLPDCRVMVVHSKTNIINVYTSRQVKLERGLDMIQLLDDSSHLYR